MNPSAPTPPSPESNPPDQAPDLPKTPPQAETPAKENIVSPVANAIESNPVENVKLENPTAAESPIIHSTAQPDKETKPKPKFHRDPEDVDNSNGDDDFRNREPMPIWLKTLLVILSLLILMPFALALFIYVVCSSSLRSNHGHW